MHNVPPPVTEGPDDDLAKAWIVLAEHELHIHKGYSHVMADAAESAVRYMNDMTVQMAQVQKQILSP